jgi:hypothetical protein
VLVLFLEPAGLPRFLTTTRRKGVNLTKKGVNFPLFILLSYTLNLSSQAFHSQFYICLTCPFTTAYLFAFPSIKSFNSCFPVSLNGTYPISLASPLHSNWPWKWDLQVKLGPKGKLTFWFTLFNQMWWTALHCLFCCIWSTLKRGFRL